MTKETTYTKLTASFYDEANSEVSARELVYEVYPHWKSDPGPVNIVRLTDGVMNTLLKITKQVSAYSATRNDEESVLLRAYGRNSDVLIDRDMEATIHAQLAERGLASPLLARFKNGLLYKFVPGRVCTAQDLIRGPIWRAVAAHLGEWHAPLPLPSSETIETDPDRLIIPSRTIWTVMHQWVAALPIGSPEAEARKKTLEKELDKSFNELNRNGCEDYHTYVMGHCDLLSANVIIRSNPVIKERGSPGSTIDSYGSPVRSIHFIDYEYAVPCPTAFDLANHFSEWGGYDCDYHMLPTQATRRLFIEEYMQSYNQHAARNKTVEELCHGVDQYRGMPGFYWGVHALIQEAISDVKFDWASYAELRLAEFWAWRREKEGSRAEAGEQMPLREDSWAQPA